MISRLFIVTLFVLVGLGSSGCFSFGRKTKASTEQNEARISGTPVADMEKSFKVRWVAQRSAELKAKGVAQAQADAQAEVDYASTFQYTKPGK